MRLTYVLFAAVLVGSGIATPAQESEPTPPAQAPAAEAAAPSPDSEPPAKKKKIENGLYVYVGAGSGDSHDIDSSIETLVRRTTTSTFSLPGVDYGKVALGWRLPNHRGDFRLTYNGYKETDFLFESTGYENTVDPALGLAAVGVDDNLLWWTMTGKPGSLVSARTPPQWDTSHDKNMNGRITADEVFYIGPDLEQQRGLTDDLQNRVYTTDLTFGNSFGGRHFGSHWFGGLRFYGYEGNVLAGAWLDTGAAGRAGEGWTDGVFLPPLLLHQDTSGWGPTGSMTADFKFFDERLTLYVKGQIAFTMSTIKVDTGPFFTIVVQTSNPPLSIPAPAELVEERSKSVWNTNGEVGVRLNLKNGLELDLAYSATGFLDSVIMPLVLKVPGKAAEAPQGTSATYRTRDLILQVWRLGVGFQF